MVIGSWTRKGGVGKTTVSVGLAEAAALGTRSVLIDAEAQGSALRWAQLAARAGTPLRSVIAPAAVPDAGRWIGSLGEGAGVVVMDMPLHGPGAERIASSAVAAADIIVVPCPPELAVLDRVASTVQEIARWDTPYLVVLTMVRAGLPERETSREALTTWGMPVARTELPLSVAVQRNYGQPVFGETARGRAPAPVSPLGGFSVSLLSELLAVLREKRGNTP